MCRVRRNGCIGIHPPIELLFTFLFLFSNVLYLKRQMTIRNVFTSLA